MLTPSIPSTRDLRLFGGLWLPLALVFFAGLLFFKSDDRRVGACLAFLAMTIAAAGWSAPESLRPLYVVWTGAVFPIGWLVSHALLAAIFFLLFTPTALVLRLLAIDPLHLKPDPSAESYWTPRLPARSSSRYFRQS